MQLLTHFHDRSCKLILLLLVAVISACTAPPEATQQPPNIVETQIQQYALATFNALMISDTNATAVAEITQAAQLALNTPTPENTPTITLTATPEPTYTPSPTHTITLTPTITQTPTPTITSTYEICSYGNNGRYTAHYTRRSPTIDGDLTDWNAKLFKPIKEIVSGDAFWAGDFDLWGFFQTFWDDEYLYVAVKVQDERYVQTVDEPAQMEKGDALVLLFDADLCGDFGDSTMSADDTRIGFTPGYVYPNNLKAVYRWFPKPATRIYTTNYTTRRDGETVFYEIRIPWKDLGVSNPGIGQPFGLTVSISDNDDPQQQIQETVLATDQWENNPRTWSILILK